MSIGYPSKIPTHFLRCLVDAKNPRSLYPDGLLHNPWVSTAGTTSVAIGSDGALLKSTGTSWQGNFGANPTTTGWYVVSFTYYTLSGSDAISFDNDGIMDNTYNQAITPTTTRQTFQRTVFHNTTGTIQFYFSAPSTTDVYISDFKFFKVGQWTDISGYNNHFTLNDISWNASGYFSFNGSTSYAESNPSTPNSFTADNDASTVSVWFRPTSNQGGANKAIITDNAGPEYGIWYDGTNVRSYAYAATNSVGATAVNDWVNVTMVVPYAARPGDAGSGSTGVYRVRQYINGKLSGSDTSSTVGNGLNDWPLNIGRDLAGGGTAYFTGDIGFVAIWQTALNDADIMKVYNTLRGRG